MPSKSFSRVRDLALAFLQTHGERALQTLSEDLRRPEDAAPLPVHRALFATSVNHIREPAPARVVAEVREILAGGGALQPVISGQVALWTIHHRLIREIDGPHRWPDTIHIVLALVGDALDGITGALINLAQSGNAPQSVAPPEWDTLVELGRMHREFRMLNRVTHDLLDARTPEKMFETLEVGILNTFHLRSLVIATANRAEGFVEVVRAFPSSPETRDPVGWRYDLSHPEILCDVARSGRTEVIDGWDPRYHERVVREDGSAAFRQRPQDFNKGQTAYFVPILAGDRAIGVACTASAQADRPLILHQIERMSPFLHQVGMALSLVSEIIERQRVEVALREANARLTEASRLKSEFLANTTHEIRTPMTNIIGSLQTVLDGLCENREEEVSFLRSALDSSGHLLTLINDLLDASRIEANRIEVNAGEVRLAPVFREVERMMARAASEKVLQMAFTVSGEGSAVVRGDATRVRQVLINLVGNAVKFTPEGGTISVTAKKMRNDECRRMNTPLPPGNPPDEAHPGGWVEVSVADTGIGVPEEMQRLVFEKFTQVDGSTTRKYGGAGLGLYICRSLIERMGGEIGLESRGPGCGTRVFFRLPATE